MQGISAVAHRASRSRFVRVQANWGAPVDFKSCTVTSNRQVGQTSMHKIIVEVGPSGAAAFTRPGQYIQAKTSAEGKAGFFAIASKASPSSFELLIKAASGTTSEAITQLASGSELLASDAQGKGYPLEKTELSELILLICAGSGIAPIRSVIESGSLKGKKVKMFYGSKSSDLTAYAELIPQWEAQGIKVIQVFSGETKNYVQNHPDLCQFDGVNPSMVSALLCGQKDLCTGVTERLVEKGVSKESILMNF
jgi:ferredoxin-NADP reductase